MLHMLHFSAGMLHAAVPEAIGPHQFNDFFTGPMSMRNANSPPHGLVSFQQQVKVHVLDMASCDFRHFCLFAGFLMLNFCCPMIFFGVHCLIFATRIFLG